MQVQLGGYREVRGTLVQLSLNWGKKTMVGVRIRRCDHTDYMAGERKFSQPKVTKRLNNQNGLHPQTILKLQLGHSSKLSTGLHKEGEAFSEGSRHRPVQSGSPVGSVAGQQGTLRSTNSPGMSHILQCGAQSIKKITRRTDIYYKSQFIFPFCVSKVSLSVSNEQLTDWKTA